MNPKKAEYIISAVSKKQYPNIGYPSFLFVGRSNVGKSSFINALTSRKNLAYTSSKPGKTVALNFYNIDDCFIFIDVPGYGYAQKKIEDRLYYGQMIEELLATFEPLKICFLIVDIRHSPTEDDVLMYNYLKHCEKKVIIIATKLDKISNNKLTEAIKTIRTKFNLRSDDLCLPISSMSKRGIEKVDEIINSYRSLL